MYYEFSRRRKIFRGHPRNSASTSFEEFLVLTVDPIGICLTVTDLLDSQLTTFHVASKPITSATNPRQERTRKWLCAGPTVQLLDGRQYGNLRS